MTQQVSTFRIEPAYRTESGSETSQTNKPGPSTQTEPEILSASQTEPATFHWISAESAQLEDVFTLEASRSNSFVCPDCNRVCTTQRQLDMHRRQHSKENRILNPDSEELNRKMTSSVLKTFPCDLCSKKTWSSLHLKTHRRTHTDDSDDFRCFQCNHNFENITKLLVHVEQAHAFQCPSCEAHFANTNDLSRHFSKVHLESRRAPEKDCENVTKQERGILNTSQTKIQSIESLPTFNIPSQVRINPPATCPSCSSSEVFKSVKAFDHHVQSSHPYKCPMCSKMVKMCSSVRRHFQSFHPRERAFFCSSCTRVFISERDLKEHTNCWNNRRKNPDSKNGDDWNIPPLDELLKMDIVTPAEDEIILEVLAIIPAVNQVCDVETESDVEDNEPLKKEKKKSESEEFSFGDDKGFRCQICPDDDDESEFDREAELWKHMSEYHPIQCPICQHPFRQFDNLDKHCKTTHNNWKVTACRRCAIAFVGPEKKLAHMRKFHLKNPKKIKTVDKPSDKPEEVSSQQGFKCPECPKVYNVADSVRKHCKTVHKVTAFSCIPCGITFASAERRRLHLNTDMHRSMSSSSSLNSSQRSLTEDSEDSQDSVENKCPWCEKTYDIGKSLQRHCSKVHSKTVFLCRSCDTVFLSAEERNKHVETNHMSRNSQTETEPSCTESSDDVQNSTMPSTSSTNNSFIYQPMDVEFGCEICQIEFVGDVELKNHMDEHHPYQCPLCPRRYKYSRSLTKHYKHHHNSNAMLHICHQCAKAFVKEAQFTKHTCNEYGTKDTEESQSKPPSDDFIGFNVKDIEDSLQHVANLRKACEEVFADLTD